MSVQAWCAFQDGATASFDVNLNGSSILSGGAASWSVDTLVEPSLSTTSFSVGNTLSFDYIAGTTQIYEPQITVIVEYD